MRSIPRATSPAAAIAVAAVLGLSAAGCGGESVKYAGESIKEPEAFLTQIEGTWKSDIAQDRVTRHKDARCYFSTPAEGDSKTIEQLVYCGPARHYTEKTASEAADDAEDVREDDDYEGPKPGDAGPGSWDTYAFQVTKSDPEGKGDYELITPRPQLWGTEVTAGMKLFRPDGDEPPEDAKKLAAPPPPPIDSGYVQVTSEVDIKGAKQPKDARIVTPRTTVSISQLGTTDHVDTDQGKRGPADGEKFVVAKVSLADGPFAERYQNAWGDDDVVNADVTYALQLGDDRKRLDLSSQYGSSETKEATIVASVPKNSDPQLLVSAAGKDQAISLTSGKRTSKTAEAFYETTSEKGVSRQYSTQTFTKGDFEFSLSLLFSNAQLVPFDPVRGWAQEGNNWLILTTEQVEADWDSYPYSLFYDREKTMTVKDGDGRTYKDQIKSETWENAPGDVTSLFEVPDDATTFTVTYKPTFTFSSEASAEFYQPTSGAGTLTPLTFDVSFEK